MHIITIAKRIQEKKTVKFSKIAEDWLEQKKLEIKESTYSNYKYMIHKYLFPNLGKQKIAELRDYNYNELINNLEKKLSSKTVRDAATILKQILCYIENEYNINVNKSKITMPKLQKERISIFTKAEKTKIEKYCMKAEKLKDIGILICLNTGLRIGEICGLKWENIDLNRRILYVNKTIERIYEKDLEKTKIIISKPKTSCSIRQIPICNKLYSILKPLKKQYANEDYFLTGKRYKYIEPNNYRRYYRNVLKKCKVDNHKFHCLRHTFSTECVRVGMDVKSLSEILGHSNVNITLNTYVHSSYEVQKKYLERL